MSYKYCSKKEIEHVKKLFFRTYLRKNEDIIDNRDITISKETGLKIGVVTKIINIEILKLKNSRI